MGLFDNISGLGGAGFGELSDSLSRVRNQVTGFAKDTMDQGKLYAEIKPLNDQVARHYQTIGLWYYTQCRKGGEPQNYEEEFDALDILLAQIAEKQAQINEIKAQVTCASCGKSVAPGSAFCPSCGAPIVRAETAHIAAEETAEAEAEPEPAGDEDTTPAESTETSENTSASEAPVESGDEAENKQREPMTLSYYEQEEPTLAESVPEIVPGEAEEPAPEERNADAPCYCKVCGSPLEPGYAFCMNCGTPVATMMEPEEGVAETSETALVPEAAETPITPDEERQQDSAEPVHTEPVHAQPVHAGRREYGRHCSSCGAVLLDSSRFCMTCGTRFINNSFR